MPVGTASLAARGLSEINQSRRGERVNHFMLTTVSSNAILAKSRAMYGRRLTERNYTELLNCHSVNEVANYLKNRTAYADMFEGTTATDIHRGQLETMLKKRVFDQYASLCRYEMAIGQDFYQYFIAVSYTHLTLPTT